MPDITILLNTAREFLNKDSYFTGILLVLLVIEAARLIKNGNKRSLSKRIYDFAGFVCVSTLFLYLNALFIIGIDGWFKIAGFAYFSTRYLLLGKFVLTLISALLFKKFAYTGIPGKFNRNFYDSLWVEIFTILGVSVISANLIVVIFLALLFGRIILMK